MCKKTSTILLSILVLVCVPGIVVGDVVKDIAEKAAEAAFSEAERQAIEKYYKVTASLRGKEYETKHDDDDDINDKRSSGGKKKDKGKGKGKKSGLPRGIAKKLARGGTLPPGHAKRYLPSELKTQLPTVPKGYERIESDGQVLLANIATGVISDIINIATKPSTVMTKKHSVEKSSTREEESRASEKGQAPVKPEKRWWQVWKD